MKKRISLSFVALSVFIVLMLGIVPHHHHDTGVACMMAGHCEESCASDNGQANRGKQTCVAQSLYQSNNTENRLRVSSCDDCDSRHHTHLFPVLYAIADLLLLPTEINFANPEYGEPSFLYNSAEVSRFHGLRAPPAILS